MKKNVLLIGLLLFCVTVRCQLVINELMQSNIDCIMDDLNEFPDSWVELYNTTAQNVSLSDYAIGTKASAKKAYSLPAQSVPANGYVIIYCDKEEQGLHTDFRLESGKDGCVYLFKNGEPIDSLVAMKKQPAPNIAYGRKTDGANDCGYQAVPTPGQTNCGTVYKKCLDNPIITPRGQVLASKQNLQITMALPEEAPVNTVIRYTLDGSEPQANSLVYAAPINVDTTTILRAKLFADGYLSPRSATESYIYLNREMTLPIVSIVTDEVFLSDSKIGILVDGDYDPSKANYTYKWRRPCNFELFTEPQTASQLNQLGETRTHGGGSLTYPQKSLDIYANKRFGEKRLNYEFFPDQKPGLTDFKTITLRNGGNDFQYLHMRDALMQRTMAAHRDIDWQAYQPVIMYINGRYYGILNIREKSNEDYLYTNYNGIEDIDMLEIDSVPQLKEGTWDEWNKFKQFYSEKGHTYDEYSQWINCDDVLDIYIMNIFFNNQDFPGNNLIFWRPQNIEDGLPMKWRMYAKDTDFGLGLYNKVADYNTFAWLYDENYDPSQTLGNKSQHTLMFRNLMEDSLFRTRFIDHSAIYIGDFLNEPGMRPLWDSMVNQISYEYPYHFELYKENPTCWLMDFDKSLKEARQWLRDRVNPYYKYMGEFYQLGSPIPMTISVDSSLVDVQEIQLMFNQITLSKPNWNGQFYANRPIQIVASNQDEALRDAVWTITYTKDNTEYHQTIEGNTCQWEIPTNCLFVHITLSKGGRTDLTKPFDTKHIDALKRLENNQIVIIRNNKKYSAIGTQIH